MIARDCVYSPTTEMGRNLDDSYDPNREEDHYLGVFKYEMSLGHGERKVRFVVLMRRSFLGRLTTHLRYEQALLEEEVSATTPALPQTNPTPAPLIKDAK